MSKSIGDRGVYARPQSKDDAQHIFNDFNEQQGITYRQWLIGQAVNTGNTGNRGHLDSLGIELSAASAIRLADEVIKRLDKEKSNEKTIP